MNVPLCIITPIFFLTCVPLLIISFAFLVFRFFTLGYFLHAVSDHITRGAWLEVTVTLGGDAVLMLSSCWGGWNVL